MPQVQQYGASKVSTQVVQGARAQSLPQGAFPLSQVAQGLGQVAQEVKQFQVKVDTTAAEEAMVGFERDKNNLFFNPDNGYFNTKGRTAYDSAAPMQKSLEELAKKYEDTLGTNEAKNMFKRVSQSHLTRATTSIMQHAAKGQKSWEIATINSQVENTVENAALYWNDSQVMSQQMALGEMAIHDAAGLEGIDGQALNERLQTYRSSFASTAVNAAAQQSYEEGKATFDSQEKMLEGPDKVKLEKMLEVKKKQADETDSSSKAVINAAKFVDEYDTREQILEQVNEIEDPIVQKKTRAEAMYQFNVKRQAASEERGDAFETAELYIAEGNSPEQFKVNYPEQWDILSPKQKLLVEKGGTVRTNYVTLSELLLRPAKDLAKVDPVDYFDQLADTERKQLISAVMSAQGKGSQSDKVQNQVGRSRTAETTAAAVQIFGERNKQDVEQVNAFYETLNDEAISREEIKGSKLTSQEYTALLNDFTRKVVVEGLFFDSERDIEDIPAEDIKPLSDFLRNNGVPVTADNLIKAYEQAK